MRTAAPRALDCDMKVIVNGQEREVPAGETVATLIDRVGLGAAACAAEVNKKLVPKREHGDRELAEGDVIELVSLVGGG